MFGREALGWMAGAVIRMPGARRVRARQASPPGVVGGAYGRPTLQGSDTRRDGLRGSPPPPALCISHALVQGTACVVTGTNVVRPHKTWIW